MENPSVPAGALSVARTAVAALREELQRLFEAIPPGPNSAIRFEAGEEH